MKGKSELQMSLPSMPFLSSTFRIFKVEVHLSLVLEFFGGICFQILFIRKTLDFSLKLLCLSTSWKLCVLQKLNHLIRIKAKKRKMLTVIKLNIIWCRTWRFKYRDEMLRPSMCHLNGQQQCRRPSLSSPSHQE
jgi:hypothetical protein